MDALRCPPGDADVTTLSGGERRRLEIGRVGHRERRQGQEVVAEDGAQPLGRGRRVGRTGQPVELGQGQEYLVHRHGFLCATPQVTITLGFQQSLGAGIFGGDGFLLQRIGGAGTAWLELSGELVQKNLAPGEVLRVHPGHVGAFQASVGFQITMVPGIKNMIFGADGIFLAQLVGPGAVWLQTLPISRLAHQIYEYLPKAPAAQQAGGAGLVGGILGSIIAGGQ